MSLPRLPRPVKLLLLLTVLVSPSLAAREKMPAEGLKRIGEKQLARMNAALEGNRRKSHDTPVRVLKAYMPIYPISRALDGKSGACLVTFTVGKSGKAEGAVAEPGADEKMCDHALYALRYWEFVPATKNGQPVEADMRLPVAYDIGR